MLPLYHSSDIKPDLIRRRGTRRFSLSGLLAALLVVVVIPAAMAYGLAETSEVKVLAGILGFLGALIIFARPYYGLIVFTGFLYIRIEEMTPSLQGFRCTLVIGVLTLAGMLLHHWVNREKLKQLPLTTMMVGFVLAGIVATAVNAGDTFKVVQDIGKMVMLVFLIVNLVRTPQAYRTLINSLLVCTGYLALFSAYRYLTGVTLVYQSENAVVDTGRSQGIGMFGDPNDLAATLVAGLALTLSRAIGIRGKQRFFYLSLAALILWAAFLTNSRGGMLALLTVLFGYFLMFQKRKLPAIMTAVVLGSVILVAAPSRMTNFDRNDDSAQGRLMFWDNGIDQLIQHPLTGLGYEKFAGVNGGYTAHNSFVLCFAELGLPGYFFWMGCLYYAFRGRLGESSGEWVSESDQRDLLGARLALVGFLVACFWISRTYIPVLYLLVSLPVISTTMERATSGPSHLASQLQWHDVKRIALLCLGSILFIKIFETALR